MAGCVGAGVDVGGLLVGDAGAGSCISSPQTINMRVAVAISGSISLVFRFSGINSRLPERVLVLMGTRWSGRAVSLIRSRQEAR